MAQSGHRTKKHAKGLDAGTQEGKTEELLDFRLEKQLFETQHTGRETHLQEKQRTLFWILLHLRS